MNDVSEVVILVNNLVLVNQPGAPLEVTLKGGVSKSSSKTVVIWAFRRKELLNNSKVKINFLMVMVLGYSVNSIG